MGDKGLLKIAKIDILCSKKILEINDEVAVNLAGYHVQQAIEKILKHLILMTGTGYVRDHRIELLVEQAANLGIQIPQEVANMQYVLSEWALRTRYNSDRVVPIKGLLSMINVLDKWLLEIESTATVAPRESNYFTER